MTKKREILFTITAILLMIITTVIITFAITNSNIVSAEGLDNLSENTMVNFNQLSNWYSLSNSYYNFGSVNSNGFATISLKNTSVTWARMTLSDVSVTTTDKIYFRVSTSTDTNINFYGGSSGAYIGDYSNNSSFITTGYTKYQFALANYFAANSSSTISFRCIMINLTTMFGETVANTITVEQCDSFFTAEYYSYTEGTTMPFSKGYLQGYTEGQQDLYNSLTVTYNNDILGTISYAANIAGISSSIGYDNSTSTYLVSGLAGIHFGDYLTTTIDFSAKYWAAGADMSSLYVAFFKYEGSTLVPLVVKQVGSGGNFEDGSGNYDGSSEFSFNINNVDTIYFGMFDSSTNFTNTTVVTMYCFSAAMQLNTINVAALSNAAYSRGYQAAAEYYTTEGTTGYNTIYNIGYNAALADTNAPVNAMQVAAAAFTGVGEILQIELLPGFPLSAFVLVPLMLGLIFFVIKVAKGGS